MHTELHIHKGRSRHQKELFWLIFVLSKLWAESIPLYPETAFINCKISQGEISLFPMFWFLRIELQLFYMYIFVSIHICCWILVLHPNEESQGQFSFSWEQSFSLKIWLLCSLIYCLAYVGQHTKYHVTIFLLWTGVFFFSSLSDR